MRYLFLFLIGLVCSACQQSYTRPAIVTELLIEPLVKDSTLSVRALDFNEEYIFYGSSDHFGKYALHIQSRTDFKAISVTDEKHHFRYFLTNDKDTLHFRAVEEVNGDFFALSIENPARLYKMKKESTQPVLVYEEIHEKVFYDCIAFWNDKEGIAIGDPTEDCMSIIVTRDGGETWNKMDCDDLPKTVQGEAAFAASNSNIATVGPETWVATGGMASRIFYSPDKGVSWKVMDTPVIQGEPTTGLYSIDFYNSEIGFGIGGDYTKPNNNSANKIKTKDGGKTWQRAADGEEPGYRSCVQYVPGSAGMELLVVGFKGIDYSKDSGETWTHLSDEGFYTLRFVNDSVAYAGGRGRISKLVLR
jgi:photosystem II stability/assembly factor-like uncharacterized protein